jgi:hypothetical protein
MNTALISVIVQLIQGAISAAPGVIKIVEQVKQFIFGLFITGAIDQATQNALMLHVDAVCDAVENGDPPPAWTVEPDPK